MTPPHVLVVENERIVALDLEECLTVMGYSVSVAVSGEEAIAATRQRTPDVVLMDIRLDGALDGIQAAEQLKAEMKVPVVFLTAHADQGTVVRAAKLGPSGYIVKPFNERALAATIYLALQAAQTAKSDQAGDALISPALKSLFHEIQTLMSVVRTSSDLALVRLSLGQDVRPNLEDIQHAAEELTSIASDVFPIASKGEGKGALHDWNEIVEASRTMIRSIAGPNILVDFALAEEPGKVLLWERNMRQILLTLVANARETMPAGGRLTVRTATEDIQDPLLCATSQLACGAYTILEVRDTGHGMQGPIREQAFLPSFSTKRRGRGFGLYFVSELASSASGGIAVHGEVGVGSTFRVYLPDMKKKESSGPQPPPASH
jgi:signal transduction histidine kinase